MTIDTLSFQRTTDTLSLFQQGQFGGSSQSTIKADSGTQRRRRKSDKSTEAYRLEFPIKTESLFCADKEQVNTAKIAANRFFS